ncbi:MAG: NPCBM/NEW2 domain-containing protein [Pseudomonadota bacterium]
MTDKSVSQFQDLALAATDEPARQAEIIEAHQQVADEKTTIAKADSAAILPQPMLKQESSRVLHAYLAAVIIVNFSLLFLKGYSADLGYWEDWINQLTRNGYSNFNGNYPPFYIHWLYLVGNFYTAVGIPLEANNFLKFLTQLPVALTHCLLATIVFSILNRFNAQRHFLHMIMMLTVFNPTILVNGPIWGQVDLIPVTFVVIALLLNFHDRFSYLAIPVFVLALLTKFQMIAFAPVFGFLFFRNIKKNLIGILISIVVGAVIFMPSIIAGHFVKAFKLAYIDTLGQYPMTTFNAANIWILLTSNTAPDSQILFGVAESSPLVKVFTAKYFGILLFVLIALWIFVQGAYQQIINTLTLNKSIRDKQTANEDNKTSLENPDSIDNSDTPKNSDALENITIENNNAHEKTAALESSLAIENDILRQKNSTFAHNDILTNNSTAVEIIQQPLSQALFASMICCMAFFTFLPAMHERYLFPAAIIALIYATAAQKKLIYPITLSLLCSLNMFIILEVNGSNIWHGLAWLMVAITILGLLETIFGETFFNRVKNASLFVYRIPVLSVWVFIAAFSVMFFSFYDKYRILEVALEKNEILLTSLPKLSATQDHGTLKNNFSYDGNRLSIGNHRYAQGLGTHANSDIKYELPEGAIQFSFIAGLDDEVGVADVQFSVWGDDKLLWESKPFYGYEEATEVQVDVRGVKVLSLKVAALKEDKWDHANWVSTVITLSQPASAP